MSNILNSHQVMSDYTKFLELKQRTQFFNQKFGFLFREKRRKQLSEEIKKHAPESSYLLEILPSNDSVWQEEGVHAIKWQRITNIFPLFEHIQQRESLDFEWLFKHPVVQLLLVLYKKFDRPTCTPDELKALKLSLRSTYVSYLEAKDMSQEISEKTFDWNKNKTYFDLIESNLKPVLYDLIKDSDEFLHPESEKKHHTTVIEGDDALEKFMGLYEDETTSDNKLPIQSQNRNYNKLQQALEKHFVDPIMFFNTVQKIFKKYDYVLTFDDIARIKSIRKDIQEWKLLFLSGDTWSWKTELAIMIGKIILEESKELNNNEITRKRKEKYGDMPIIVWWNRNTDMADFTLEKIITSRNFVTNQSSDVVVEQYNNYEKLFEQIAGSTQIKSEMNKMIDDVGDDTEKNEMRKQLEAIDLNSYHIFTEFHYKGLFLAMITGRPLIIDELNAVRPEVLIGLNHYLTRKVGQHIQLPNGLGSFQIAPGFCIICTGNDKDSNNKKEMYASRFTIDESLINRMNIYQKWYMNQVENKFENSSIYWNSSTAIETTNYLHDNELFGVLLMLFFDNWSTSKNTIWFDLTKNEFIWKSAQEKADNFFGQIQKLSIFIAKSQRAYAGEVVSTTNWKDLQNLITKKVFSMRQVRAIINAYKKSAYPLFYHLYDEFISDQWGGGTSEEMEAYLTLSRDTGLLPQGLWSDDPKECYANVKRRYTEIKTNKGWIWSSWLLTAHNQHTQVNKDLIEWWLLTLTRQEIFQQYFWSSLNQIDDSLLTWSVMEEFLTAQKENDMVDDEPSVEIDAWDVFAQLEALKSILDTSEQYANNKFFMDLDFKDTYILQAAVETLTMNDWAVLKTIDKQKLATLYSVISKILNWITVGEQVERSDIDTAFQLIATLSK